MRSKPLQPLLLTLAFAPPAFGLEHASELGETAAAEWRIRPQLEAHSEVIEQTVQKTSVGYRWWAGNQRVAFGAGVGAVNYSFAAPAGVALDHARPFTQVVGPVLTLGWRMRLGSATLYADTSTAPMLAQGVAQGDALQKRVLGGGEPWKTTQSRLGLDRGSFSLQLESGYRLSLRPRRGGLSVVLRGTF